jgi:acetylglutamate kinase
MNSQAPIVVKIGGSTLGAHDTSLQDVAWLAQQGRRIVVVHGGGPAISDWLTRVKVPTRFERGLRVTDAPALEIVVAVLGGLINKQLVAALTALGARAVGLSGADGGTLRAGYEDEALGYVGRVEEVDTRLILAMLDAGFVPVVAPLALLKHSARTEVGEVEVAAAVGQLLNVNADTVAGDLARALQAERLIFLTDVAGVRGADGAALRVLDLAAARGLLRTGVAAGGMIPKLEAAIRAAEGGTTAVILDGREPHQFVAAAGDSPPGTVIARAETESAQPFSRPPAPLSGDENGGN